MPAYEIKITAGPHVDQKTYLTAQEAVDALQVHVKSEKEAAKKAKEDEKVEKEKEEKEEQEKAEKKEKKK